LPNEAVPSAPGLSGEGAELSMLGAGDAAASLGATLLTARAGPFEPRLKVGV
jgi:hypothetical protein